MSIDPDIETFKKGCDLPAFEFFKVNIIKVKSKIVYFDFTVDKEHVQPFNYLNGGVSLFLAESFSGTAAYFYTLQLYPDLDKSNLLVFGTDVFGSHFNPAKLGERVRGETSPLHLGRKLQRWETSLFNSTNTLIFKCSVSVFIKILKK